MAQMKATSTKSTCDYPTKPIFKDRLITVEGK